jgi:CysZ protein
MNLLNGIIYNLRGLWLGIKTPKLLFWGLVRFAAVIALTIAAASLILVYQQEILNLIWKRPESAWISWLWRVLSWILSLVLVGISAVISYILSQILFSVLIMDHMSRLTELKITGTIKEAQQMPLPRLFFYLIRQEIPRAVIPLMVSLLCMLGGFTPVGPVLAALSCAIAAVFLAWDNTDLLPARQLVVFRSRFRFLSRNILFHLGFGLLFLVPGLNILFLAFAPVGATLYHLEKKTQDLV